jgi:hypothetical protein
MGFTEFLNEAVSEKEKEEFDPQELEMGIEDEKEHRDIYEIFKTILDEKNIEMPLTEEEYYQKIAEAHLRENPKYYSELKKLEGTSKNSEESKEVEEAVKPEAVSMIKSWMSKKK